eukprot:TRINITY_DN10918_c0_g1_i1.p1 TRINITY_DN10918_c0_g1~~TRINITY_DN10918_c0_g1_i1.p1  ORF type:complete len:405 (+),score=64.48 TRINITY_DN10918_c0_g1_i1:42-1217(+)
METTFDYLYAKTALYGNVVSEALICNFQSPSSSEISEEHNKMEVEAAESANDFRSGDVVLVKENVLELMQQREDEFQPLASITEQPVFGTIRAAKKVRWKSKKRDLLVITSESGYLSFVSAARNRFFTAGEVKVADRGYHRKQAGHLLAVSQNSEIIAVGARQGLVRFLRFGDSLLFPQYRSSASENDGSLIDFKCDGFIIWSMDFVVSKTEGLYLLAVVAHKKFLTPKQNQTNCVLLVEFNEKSRTASLARQIEWNQPELSPIRIIGHPELPEVIFQIYQGGISVASWQPKTFSIAAFPYHDLKMKPSDAPLITHCLWNNAKELLFTTENGDVFSTTLSTQNGAPHLLCKKFAVQTPPSSSFLLLQRDLIAFFGDNSNGMVAKVIKDEFA